MSRYDGRDNRYAPPPRDRSPARSRGAPYAAFGSRSGDFNRPFNDVRDAPRGPRGVNDPPGRTAPTAPRGRGSYAGRGDFRDGGFAGDRWHDGSDRWERPRPRSPPPRDRRDSRDVPRQIDTDRSRFDPRDAPLSAGSSLSDGPLRGGSTYRGGFGRGRGSEFRERARTDDRARPRSRSRPPVRRERDRSVDSRDMDFRERAREADENRYYRDREEREPPVRRTESRAEALKLDVREQGEIRGPAAQPTPQTERPPPFNGTPPDRRAFDTSRRGSAVSDHILGRREAERNDPNAGRPESQRAPRPASPPPSVPSFGFRVAGVTSLSWKNPDLQKPAPASGPAQPSKPAPTAPKALATAPPTMPKAERGLELSKTPSKESLIAAADEAPSMPAFQPGPTASPSPRLDSTTIVPEPQPVLKQTTPTGPPSFLNPPSAPRAMTSPQPPFGRTAGATFGRSTSPGSMAAIPTGPKASIGPNASPRMPTSVIPTGPRADRGALPTGPRSTLPAPKLFKQASQTFPRAASLIPSKRDVEGIERGRDEGNEGRQNTDTRIAADVVPVLSSSQNAAHVKRELLPENETHKDVDMADLPSATQNISPAIDDHTSTFQHLSDDEDDELDIADMVDELESKFLIHKSRLEAKRMDLSAPRVRPTLLLPEIARVLAMRALIPELSFRPRAVTEKKDVSMKEAFVAPKEQVMQPQNVQQTPVTMPTPREAAEDEVMSDFCESRESSIDRMSTPDPDMLPYLEKGPPTPLSDPDPFSTVKREYPLNDIKGLLENSVDQQARTLKEQLAQYREDYIAWRQKNMALDREKEDAERLAKQSSPEGSVAHGSVNGDMPAPPLMTPTESGRRAHRFASDYDLQRVMEISRLEEEEKRLKDTAAKEAQASAAADREAIIPDLLPLSEVRRRVFEDVSQARRPEDALRIFELCPQVDDFTEAEDRLMREAYKEFPKMWGKIAGIVKRTYKECINHYYASKWERPYKTKQGGRKGRAKGRTRGSGRRPAAMMPAEDAEVDANGVAMVTESGRPRRAAAPTWPKESDQEQSTPSAGTGKKGKPEGKEGEPAVEKKGRRKAKEKAAAKTGRNPPLAARPIESPQKVDRLAHEKFVPMDIDDPWLVKGPPIVHQTEPMPALMPQTHLYPDANLTVFRESAADLASASGPTERPRSHSNTQRQGASSYWSVTEEQDFQRCLEYYGTDFQAISNHMQTKTHTMIKNHYQKFVNDGKHSDLIQRANDANQRRNRGEDMGQPPVPSQPQKRHGRYDTANVPMPRSLAPSNEIADIEQQQQSPPTAPINVPYAMSPPFGPTRSTLAPQVPRQPALPTTTAASHRPHGPGPVMGFFREDTRPIQQPASAIRPIIAPPEEPRVQRPERIKAEFRPVADRERDIQAHQEQQRAQQEQRERDMQRMHDQMLLLQQQREQQAEHDARIARVEAERREQERLLQSRQTAMGHASIGSIHNASEHTRQESRQHHGGIYGPAPTTSAVHMNRNALVDLAASQPGRLSMGQDHRPQSPAPRHAVQQVPIAQPPLNIPMISSPAPAAAAPKEAPRRSNLMSLLNSEPEQEKPKRREPEPVPVTSQPYRIATSVQSETPPSSAPSRDGLLERPFPRPTYPPAGQHSAMSTPSNEHPTREALPPMSHRDSWPGGRQTQTFQRTNSPHSHPIHQPPGPERPSPLFGGTDYRARAFSNLNGPGRANPSPPPAAYQQHSRTPSYTHQQHQPPPSSMPIPTSVPPALHNPFGHSEQHVQGRSPHLSAQQHPPVSGRGDFGFARPPEPREARFDRFREREPSEYALQREREAREREYQEHAAAVAHQQQQQQKRYSGGGHHTPPISQPRFPPPQQTAPPDRHTGTPGAAHQQHGGYLPPQQPPPQQQQAPPPQSQEAYARRNQIWEEEQRRNSARERARQERIEAAAAEKALQQQQQRDRWAAAQQQQQAAHHGHGLVHGHGIHHGHSHSHSHSLGQPPPQQQQHEQQSQIPGPYRRAGQLPGEQEQIQAQQQPGRYGVPPGPPR